MHKLHTELFLFRQNDVVENLLKLFHKLLLSVLVAPPFCYLKGCKRNVKHQPTLYRKYMLTHSANVNLFKSENGHQQTLR